MVKRFFDLTRSVFFQYFFISSGPVQITFSTSSFVSKQKENSKIWLKPRRFLDRNKQICFIKINLWLQLLKTRFCVWKQENIQRASKRKNNFHLKWKREFLFVLIKYSIFCLFFSICAKESEINFTIRKATNWRGKKPGRETKVCRYYFQTFMGNLQTGLYSV